MNFRSLGCLFIACSFMTGCVSKPEPKPAHKEEKVLEETKKVEKKVDIKGEVKETKDESEVK